MEGDGSGAAACDRVGGEAHAVDGGLRRVDREYGQVGVPRDIFPVGVPHDDGEPVATGPGRGRDGGGEGEGLRRKGAQAEVHPLLGDVVGVEVLALGRQVVAHLAVDDGRRADVDPRGDGDCRAGRGR